MGNISKENLDKLAKLKEDLLKEGYKITNDKAAKEASQYNEDEESVLNETCQIWNISREQAIVILNTIGSFKGLRYANKVRIMQSERGISYKALMEQLKKDSAFIQSVGSLEKKYYKNYERILSYEEKQAELYVARKSNEQIEKLLAERRPLLSKTQTRYDAIGAVIYYGMMVDLEQFNDKLKENDITIKRESDKDLQEQKLLPSMRIVSVNR